MRTFLLMFALACTDAQDIAFEDWQEAYNRGSDLVAQGNLEGAEIEFKGALGFSQGLEDKQISGITQLELARIEYHSGRFDEAERRLLAVLEAKDVAAWSIVSDLHVLLGRVYSAQGNAEKSLNHHRLAVKAAEALSSEQSLSLEIARFELLGALLEQGMYAEAIGEANAFKNMNGVFIPPGGALAGEQLLEFKLQLAQAFIFGDKPSEGAALMSGSEEVELAVKNTVFKRDLLRGVLLVKQGKNAEALAILEPQASQGELQEVDPFLQAQQRYWLARAMAASGADSDAVAQQLLDGYKHLDRCGDISAWFERDLRGETAKHVSKDEMPDKIFPRKAESDEASNLGEVKQVDSLMQLLENGKFSDAVVVARKLDDGVSVYLVGGKDNPEYERMVHLLCAEAYLFGDELDNAARVLTAAEKVAFNSVELDFQTTFLWGALRAKEGKLDEAKVKLSSISEGAGFDEVPKMWRAQQRYWLAVAMAGSGDDAEAVAQRFSEANEFLSRAVDASAWFEPILREEWTKLVPDVELPPKIFPRSDDSEGGSGEAAAVGEQNAPKQGTATE